MKNDQSERAQSDSYWWRNVNSWTDNSIILPVCRYNEKQRFLLLSFDDARCVIPLASFTYSVNVTLSESGTFDLFDGHFDGQNRCATHLTIEVTNDWQNVNSDGNIDGYGYGVVTCKQIFNFSFFGFT